MIKQEIFDAVLQMEPQLQKVARKLWNHPEKSGEEKKSADYFRSILEKEGFSLVNSKTMDHAFYAAYGSGAPVIAVLGEYDALPGLSQKACAWKEPVEDGAPGHGCGHNLLGSAALVAAIAIKRFLEKSGTPGTVRFYGCPQEELLDGKVFMVAEGMFEGCDAAITWHPMDVNMTYDKAYLANTSLKLYFTGVTAHAAAAPEQGRSALDAVELTSVGVNYLREHVVDQTRIHYTTDSGGYAPNIVPARASAWYFVRAPKITYMNDTAERIVRIAQGAAMMTDTQVRIERGCSCCEFKKNVAFSDLTYANLVEADGPKYTQEEMDFADQLQKTVNPTAVARGQKAYGAEGLPLHVGVGARELWRDVPLNGSSDTGDISYIMPSCLFTTACWPIGCTPHTWQTASSAGTAIGEKGALYAAKVIAGIGYDLFTKPEVLKKITREFEENRDETPYAPMVGSKQV